MKKSLLGLLSILVLLSCVEDEKTSTTFPLEVNREINTTKTLENPLAVLSNVETQVFDLGLVSDSLLKGKDGTLIYFERDRFEVDATTPLTLKLEEYYQFKDLVTHQLSTETVDGKLLSSSGVIYLEVTDGTQEISLKENTTLPVTFPDHRIYNNDIYYGARNEEGIMKWEKDTSLVDTTLLNYQYKRLYGVDAYMSIKVPRDSLDYYLELNESFALYDLVDDINSNSTSNYQAIIDPAKINLQQLDWINVDRVVTPDGFKDVLLANEKLADYFTIYVLYEDLNSFITYYYYEAKDEIRLAQLPIKGKTQLLLVQLTADQEIYSQQITLGERDRYLIGMKKTSLEALNTFLDGISARDSSENPAVER